jgi:hypothetical protein
MNAFAIRHDGDGETPGPMLVSCRVRVASAEPLLRSASAWNPDDYLYDSNGDFVDDTVWPSCADLPDTDMDGDNVPEHEEWGCAPRTSF